MPQGIKQMERKITITYRWWRDSTKMVKPAHIEALEESAMTQIQKLMGEGCTSGELNDNIHMRGDPEDGIEYSGWWETKMEGNPEPK